MPIPKPQLLKRAKKIKLVAMDVDGVLTNGDIIVLSSGEEVKAWHAKDRLALALLRDRKDPLRIAWITGRSSKTVEDSALDLGVTDLVQKCADKKKALQSILTRRGLSFDEAAFIGDDVIDLPVMQACGLSACPADSASDILSRAHYVSRIEGGRGVVRDVLEFLLNAQGRWQNLIASFV